MQRHIKTCEHISEQDRQRIMSTFNHTQAAKARDRGAHPETSSSSAMMRGTATFSSTSFRNQHGESTPSDDDASGSSSFTSPRASRRNTAVSVETPASQEQKPSPRLSVKSILNEDDVESSGYSRGRSSERFASSGVSGAGHWQAQSPYYRHQHQTSLPPPFKSHDPRATIAHLDQASESIARVRSTIMGQPAPNPPARIQTPLHGHPLPHPGLQRSLSTSSTTTAAASSMPHTSTGRFHSINSPPGNEASIIIQQQSEEIERLRQENMDLRRNNADLKKRYNVLKEDYDRSKLGLGPGSGHRRRREGFSSSDSGSGSASGSARSSTFGSIASSSGNRGEGSIEADNFPGHGCDEDEDIRMETPRAGSAPALFVTPPVSSTAQSPKTSITSSSSSSTAAARHTGTEPKKRKIADSAGEDAR